MAGATVIGVANLIILAFGELLVGIIITDNDVAALQFYKFVVVHLFRSLSAIVNLELAFCSPVFEVILVVLRNGLETRANYYFVSTIRAFI